MNASQQDIQELIESVNKLVNAMGGRHKRSTYQPQHSGSNLNIDRIRNTTKNNSLGNNFVQEAIKLNKAMSGVADMYERLEKSTRGESDKVRKLNDSLTKFVAGSTDAISALEELTNRSNAVKNSFKSYSEGLETYKKSLSELNELSRQRKDLDTKYNQAHAKVKSAQAEFDAAKKNKKNSAEAQEKLLAAGDAAKSIARELFKLDKVIEKSLDSHNKTIDEMDKSVEAITKYNEVTGDLTAAQIIYLKDYKNVNIELGEYKDILGAITTSTKHFDKGLGHMADVMDDRSRKITNAFDEFKTGLKKAAGLLLTVAPKVAFGDLKSQLKNNVNESDYVNDAKMGVSEAQRSNIIGENRIGLRQLGHGDEQAGFRGGAYDIQKAGWQYGVQGADALKLGLQYQNSMVSSGYKGTASGTADQMTIMHNFAKQIGVTDEALKDYNDNLISSGKMAELNNKYAGLSDDQRRKKVNEEIMLRAKLNTELGFSMERQKEINQQDINKRFSGVAATVMRHVGGKMLISNYNKGKNEDEQITGDRATRLQQLHDTGVYGKDWTPDQIKQARKDSVNVYADPADKLDKAAGQGYSSLVAEQARQSPLATLGYDAQGQGVTAQNDRARMDAVKDEKLVTNDSYSDLQKNILDTTNNAFIPFNKAVMDATQRLQGLGANPAGAAMGVAGQAVTSLVGTMAGSFLSHQGGKLLSKYYPKIRESLGKKASIEGVEKAGFSFFGGEAGEAVGKAAGSAGKAGEAVGKAGEAVGKAAGSAGKAGEAVGKGAEKAGFSFFGKGAEKVGGKFAAKEGEKLAAKTIGKSLLKKIPGLSILAGLGFGAYRGFHDGDWTGAGEEVASGIAGTIPGIGTAASMAIDTHLAYRDLKNAQGDGIVNTPPTTPLSDATKIDDAQADVNQQQAKTSQTEQIEKLNKMIKLLQDQLDLQKKDSDKKEAPDDANKTGQTWTDLKQHIQDMRKGLGG